MKEEEEEVEAQTKLEKKTTMLKKDPIKVSMTQIEKQKTLEVIGTSYGKRKRRRSVGRYKCEIYTNI